MRLRFQSCVSCFSLIVRNFVSTFLRLMFFAYRQKLASAFPESRHVLSLEERHIDIRCSATQRISSTLNPVDRSRTGWELKIKWKLGFFFEIENGAREEVSDSSLTVDNSWIKRIFFTSVSSFLTWLFFLWFALGNAWIVCCWTFWNLRSSV